MRYWCVVATVTGLAITASVSGCREIAVARTLDIDSPLATRVLAETSQVLDIEHDTMGSPITAGSLSSHLEPNTQFMVQTGTRKQWPELVHAECARTYVDAKFDIVTGTRDPGLDSSPSGSVHRHGNAGKFVNLDSKGDGWVYGAQSGYTIVSGYAPIVYGKRVRAASDGTQFALEIVGAKAVDQCVERVYLITPSTYRCGDKDRTSEVVVKAGRHTVTLKRVGDYAEYDPATGRLIEGEASKQQDRRYFFQRMKLIVSHMAFPAEPTTKDAHEGVAMLTLEDLERPRPSSFVTRFVKYMQEGTGDKDVKIPASATQSDQ